MSDIRTDVGLPDYDGAQTGIAKVFWNMTEMSAAVRGSDLLQDVGVPYQRWSTDELVAHEPALVPNAHKIAGAIYYPDDETGDACLFTRRLGDECRRRGVTVLTDTTVHRLERHGNRITAVIADRCRLDADEVVLASGPEAPRLVRPLGLRLPIEPVKGYSITIDGRGIDDLPRLPLIDDRHKVVATPLGARLRVAGTAEFNGYDRQINPRRIRLLLAQLGMLLPQHAKTLAAAPRTDWACLRAMTPDGVPIIGPAPVDNLWLNVGAGHMGWTFSAGMGRLLADMIEGRTPALDPREYRLDRPTL